MSDYIESKVGKEGKILIEVSNRKGGVGFGATASKEHNEQVDNAFNQALNTIRQAANSVLATLDTLEKKPDQVKIDFGIKIDAEVGAMLAMANSSETQLRVSLGWQSTPDKEDKTE